MKLDKWFSLFFWRILIVTPRQYFEVRIRVFLSLLDSQTWHILLLEIGDSRSITDRHLFRRRHWHTVRQYCRAAQHSQEVLCRSGQVWICRGYGARNRAEIAAYVNRLQPILLKLSARDKHVWRDAIDADKDDEGDERVATKRARRLWHSTSKSSALEYESAAAQGDELNDEQRRYECSRKAQFADGYRSATHDHWTSGSSGTRRLLKTNILAEKVYQELPRRRV